MDDERICPKCERRMVFVAIVSGEKMMSAWACDCEQRQVHETRRPPGLIASIARAREWNDGSVVIVL